MITFDSTTHSYYDNENKLLSVTELLHLNHLSPDYSYVDTDLLKKSANYGTAVHAEINDYLNSNTIGISTELQEFIKQNKNNFLLGSEVIVHNDFIAGTYDYLYQSAEKGIVRVDFKTTSSKNIDYLSWQLSLYDYLDKDYKADKFELWHFTKDKGLQIIDIPKKPLEEIEKLLTATKNFENYKQELSIPQNELEEIKELQETIAQADFLIKQATTKLDEYKTKLIETMEKNAIKQFKNDYITITYVAPTTRETLDTTRLKKEQKDLIQDYIKKTATKASIRITLKGE